MELDINLCVGLLGIVVALLSREVSVNCRYVRMSYIRDRTAFSVTGKGLAMCGVGYDLASLSIAKYAATNPKTIARNKRKQEGELRQERCGKTSSDCEKNTSSAMDIVVNKGESGSVGDNDIDA